MTVGYRIAAIRLMEMINRNKKLAIVKDGRFIPGETVTVRGDIFTAPRGKVLAGWSLEENGKVDYKAGDTFRMPGGSYDLYAVWKDAETMTHTAYIYQRLS